MAEPSRSWLVSRIEVAMAEGAFTGDLVVIMELYCVGIDKPGVFALEMPAARLLHACLSEAIEIVEGGVVDSERVIAGEETEQRYRPTWTEETDAVRVSRAEVGHGEGEVERITEEAEVEEWTDPGGTSDTTTSWWELLSSWIRRTTR